MPFDLRKSSGRTKMLYNAHNFQTEKSMARTRADDINQAVVS